MSRRTIIENDHLTLYYHEDTKIVHHIYRASLRGETETLQEQLTVGLDLLQKNGGTKWLSDNRPFSSHTDEETEWINTEWLPRAITAGWKYWALVVPHSFASRVHMSTFTQSFYDMGLRVMVFTDLDEAMQWLINIDA